MRPRLQEKFSLDLLQQDYPASQDGKGICDALNACCKRGVQKEVHAGASAETSHEFADCISGYVCIIV